MNTSRSNLNDADRPPRGFAASARRTSAFTSRVLLSAVVVVAGIGFGRQVLQWWRDDAAALEQPPGAATRLGHPWAEHEVSLGDRPWSIVRRTFQGDAAAAGRALVADAQRAASETDGLKKPPPGPQERELLARLAGSEPDVHAPGGLSLYALPGGFPMVVGTRTDSPAERPKEYAQPTDVATWGIAVPESPKTWNLYTFLPLGGQQGSSVLRPSDEVVSSEAEPTYRPAVTRRGGLHPPVPPGCRRLLEVRAIGGELSLVFTGPSQPGQWRAFYDHWAADAGLHSPRGWQARQGAWHVTYASAGPNPAIVEIHFDEGRGVILAGPSPYP